MKDANGERGFVEVAICLALIAGLVIVFVGRCAANVDGSTHDAATKSAEAYLKELGVEAGHISCAGTDSDGDGYVSCTVAKPNGELFGIECAGAITMNSGCRIPKLRAGAQYQ